MNDTTATVPVLLTEDEVASRLRVHVKTLGNWRARRLGPPFQKLEGAVRYDAAKLAEWIDQRTVDGARNESAGNSASATAATSGKGGGGSSARPSRRGWNTREQN